MVLKLIKKCIQKVSQSPNSSMAQQKAQRMSNHIVRTLLLGIYPYNNKTLFLVNLNDSYQQDIFKETTQSCKFQEKAGAAGHVLGVSQHL